MVDDGADVLFPVAGLTSDGVLDAACEQGVWGIGVDTDWWTENPAFRPCTVSSAELRIASTVERAILRWAEAAPAMQTGEYWNTAANEGITWSTIRNIEASPELEEALHIAYAGLAAGWIDPCAPTSCYPK